jgi:tRNA (guanine37-N1)-methyltransferase
MQFDVLTLFPEMFSGYLGQSLLRLAILRGLVDVRLHDIRRWAEGKHQSVDDRPFGGGPGMVLKVEPVVQCVEDVRRFGRLRRAEQSPQPKVESQEVEPEETEKSRSASGGDDAHLIMLTPQGRPLNQGIVAQLAQHERLILLCGRYEGFDERIRWILRPDEISIGDYILGGGEVAAMVVIDAVARLIPGVLGDEESNLTDSFSGGRRLLEHGQYTRPREYRGLSVPEVLLSGNHEQIAAWRAFQSYQRTKQRRPDLLDDSTSGGP